MEIKESNKMGTSKLAVTMSLTPQHATKEEILQNAHNKYPGQKSIVGSWISEILSKKEVATPLYDNAISNKEEER